jgi:hypothetical protein
MEGFMMRWIVPIMVFMVHLTAGAQTPGNLAGVRVIHLGDITGSDRAERFRSLVGKELSDLGFIVTESENAETTLSGCLTVDTQEQAAGGQTGGIVTTVPLEAKLYCECKVALTNKEGAVLWKWDGTAGSARFWDTVEIEPVASLALKLARAFEKDYRKAVRKKTRETK